MLKEEIRKFKKNGELYLRIKVNPNSSLTAFTSRMDDDTIKIDVKAQPEKGKANKELIKYLSRVFEINKDDIKILSGVNNKLKLVKIKK